MSTPAQTARAPGPGIAATIRAKGELLPGWVWMLGPYALAAIAAGLAYWVFRAHAPSVYKPPAGISVFALMFVLAQAIERLLIPLGTVIDTVKPEADKKGEPENVKKTAWMWAVATGLALFTCAWFGVLLLDAIGVSGAAKGFDLAVTGLVIGAGTKPLHDLISNLQKSG